MPPGPRNEDPAQTLELERRPSVSCSGKEHCSHSPELKAATPPGDTVDMLNQAKTDRWPYATITLIGINVLVFVFELSLGLRFAPFLQQWGLVPVRVSNEVGVHNMLTLATSLFLQVGWLQLLANLWFLWVFGDAVEDAFGWRWFVAIFALSGLFANVVFTVASPASAIPAVGASGAIGGVLGASLVLWPRARLRIPAVLVIFFALMLVYESRPGDRHLGDRSQHTRRLWHRRRSGALCGVDAAHRGVARDELSTSPRRDLRGCRAEGVDAAGLARARVLLSTDVLERHDDDREPPVRRCGQRLGLPRRAWHWRRLGEDPPQAGQRVNGTGGAGLLPGWG